MNTEKTELKKTLDNTKNEIKQSSIDWLIYIKQHPIQSIFFAASIALAFKNMVDMSKRE